MMIKKMLAIVLVLMMVLSAAACTQQEAFSLDDCAAVLLDTVSEPAYGSVGGEWTVLGLARWGGEVPKEWFDGYYERLEAHVVSCEGILDTRKYTEYSRVILALTAIGKDPSDVGGCDLLLPLADYEQIIFQGVNGPIYALLALDSGNYEIPENAAGTTQATRELYVDYILNAACPGGGWTLAGSEADADITAMALQALAKYQDRPDVAEAVERGVTVLSELQNDAGGFASDGLESSESVSQVITALAELGIPVDDSRFVKNGNTLKDCLLTYWDADGGFRHVADGEADLMATEQAFYALVALERMEQGKTSLYDMTVIR